MTGKDWAGVGNVCHAMSDEDGASLLPAETRARVRIDQQLTQAGWKVQDKRDLNLFAGQGIAVREVVMKPGHGRVDYLLYVDKAVVGVIEAKPMGTPLSGVEWQSAMYADGLPADVRLAAKTRDGRLPFVFEASGVETHFTNGFDPEPRARLIFNFPKPATLARILPMPRRSARRGAPRSEIFRPWMPTRCALRRSKLSMESRRALPISISTDHWCRWRPGPARPTPRSPSPTGC